MAERPSGVGDSWPTIEDSLVVVHQLAGRSRLFLLVRAIFQASRSSVSIKDIRPICVTGISSSSMILRKQRGV